MCKILALVLSYLYLGCMLLACLKPRFLSSYRGTGCSTDPVYFILHLLFSSWECLWWGFSFIGPDEFNKFSRYICMMKGNLYCLMAPCFVLGKVVFLILLEVLSEDTTLSIISFPHTQKIVLVWRWEN